MYDKQVVRRRRAVLAVLVGLSIVLLTGYFGEGSGGFFHNLQSGGQTVLWPIEDGDCDRLQPGGYPNAPLADHGGPRPALQAGARPRRLVRRRVRRQGREQDAQEGARRGT